ncbi:MAG TPA: bifunctional phosphoribosylaminoimidazolecarboxamide formyltransferase/IMP cyclohydrolase [Erysipelothrix sp.]|nr:bifunctional phosphoribosylaminoimidazolecarboxamide formyltransferase/IMP cyclohydrolase [Erysipelothrix sp.]
MYALISVSDKRNLIPFAKKLVEKNYTLISSGGTHQYLKEHGLEPLMVEDITHAKEMLGGRVKTLHPLIHGSILYMRDNEDHLEDKEERNLIDLSLVVCNLYPFEHVLRENKDEDTLIENIDIGGPAMIRAAAKNYRDVLVCVDPDDYDEVIDNLDNVEYRKECAYKAFSYTASYDALISNTFAKNLDDKFPEMLTQTYRKKQDLRYGENPHQSAAYYERIDAYDNIPFTQLHGKELSYNNINDLTGALKSLVHFNKPTAVAVKHANACGIASGETILEAYTKAFNSDPISIFGGIIALNETVDEKTALKLSETFLEIVLAPSFTKEALAVLTKKKNLRLLEIKDIVEKRPLTLKGVLNGILVQDEDTLDYEKLEVVSKREPTEQEWDDLLFGWNAVKAIDSNAVVLSKDEETLALGHGEVRRVWSLEKSIERSVKDVAGSILASDGFFFEDTVEACHNAGIKAIIQPGGSVKDPNVIEACDKYDIALVFTGTRHFKH